MTDKWILITGGSRGIGRELVETLSADWNLVFTWKSNDAAGQALIDELSDRAHWVEGYRCDGASADDVQSLASRLLERHGAPFAIIHNAGITQDGLHVRHSPESWQQVMDSNLNAVFNWNRLLLPGMMIAGEGSIVMMSSVSGIKGNIGQTAYAASKAAMIGLGRSLALEVGRFGIRVNCLVPGIIDSDMTKAMPEDKLSAMKKLIPLRRIGTPREVAQAAAFLLSDASAYMTGQTLVLDGGLTA